MAFIHGSEFLIGATLLVENLPSGLSTDHLTQIFKFGAPPVRLKVFFQNSSTPGTVKRFCLVEFESQEQLNQGVLLNGKEFFGSKLMIKLASLDNVPKIDQNMPIETGVGTIVNKFAPPPIEALRPPSRFPPLTPQQTDEVSRTIYVGNVNSEVTQDILQGLFETCGKITYIRLAGDDTHPSRFAFIEFLTKEAAQEAMSMNGKILVDRPLKVNHSKNPIVKTPTTTPREEEAIQRRLRRAADRIERSIRRESEKRGSRSRSRSKSRKERERSPEKEKEREREREKRHRSPSPEYYEDYYDRKYKRSSSRERSHHHSSSSRSSHHHHHDPYDKYSHSHSRSSRDRYSRSSKYYPEDDYYYRERDYYHDRDRDRDREREREREREYYKEKERRDRKHSSSSHKSSSHHHSSSSSSSSRRDKSSSDKRKRSPSPSSDKDAKKQKYDEKSDISAKN